MIKIHIEEMDGRLIIYVEGRLAGAFVPELENCWNMARSGDSGRRISVDLSGITCVDRSGRYLLQLMHSCGVEFLRPGIALQDILQQVKEQQECRP